MNTELPSEKLARKPRPIRAVVIGAASLALIAGAAVGVPAAVHAMMPAPRTVAAADPVPTAAPCGGMSYGQGVCVTDDQQATADQQLAQLEADNAAKVKAAADAAAAQQAAAQAAADQAAQKAAAAKAPAPRVSSGGGGAGLPSGAVPPNVAGTNSPDSTACASSSVTSDGSGGFVCL